MKLTIFGASVEVGFDKDELEAGRIERAAQKIVAKEIRDEQAKKRSDEIRAEVQVRKEAIEAAAQHLRDNPELHKNDASAVRIAKAKAELEAAEKAGA